MVSKLDSMCYVEFVETLLKQIKEDYNDERELWNDAGDFGRFVIDELQQLDELDFNNEEEDE